MSPGPGREVRQALAPTGKFRVALYLGAPASIVRGAALDESKGVGFDLGKELARRIGVPFEPVVYPSPGAIMEGLKSGEDIVVDGGLTLQPGAAVVPKPFSAEKAAKPADEAPKDKPAKKGD